MKTSLPSRMGLMAAAIAGMVPLAHAQAVPGIGDLLRQVPTQPVAPREGPPLPPLGGQPVEPPMEALPDGGTRVQVQRFEIVGNRVIDTNTLLALAAMDAGKNLTLAELEAAATRLTRYYRSHGYFVARVYVPEQEVKNGVVTLRAVEGNYGQFILTNHSLVADDIVQAMLDDVKKYNIVSTATLERAMLIINDTPGSRVVRAEVMPGKAVGTSDFAVGTEATPRIDGWALLDNYGSVYTGRERLNLAANWNSPTGRGDRLSLQGLGSVSGGLLNGRAAYSASLAPSGWRGELALSHTRYQLGDAYQALGAQGSADSVELSASYPILRTTLRTISSTFTYANKSLKDEISATGTSTPKASQSLAANLLLRDEAFLLGLDGLTQAGASLALGTLSIHDDTARALDQAVGGPNTQGAYSKLNLSLSRTSVVNRDYSVSVGLNGQFAMGRNLDSSERMGIAGSGGVLAYPIGDLSGSDAILSRVEVRREQGKTRQGLLGQLSLFADWGQARPVRSTPWRSLGDIGIGWSATHGSGLTIKLDLAHRLGGDPVTEPAAKNLFLAQAGWIF